MTYSTLFSSIDFNPQNITFKKVNEINDYSKEREYIENFWNQSLIENPQLYNGKIVGIDKIKASDTLIQMEFYSIDYKHLLGLKNFYINDSKRSPKHLCVGSILSINDELIIGRSNRDFKAIGGIVEGGENIDLKIELLREIKEEINVGYQDLSINKGILIINTALNSIIIFLNVNLLIDKEVLLEKFKNRSDKELDGLAFTKYNEIDNLNKYEKYFPLISKYLKNAKI